MKTYEVNFDGLVGPTHNYAGLSLGNIAATKNALSISNPKKAALEGLQKMWFLHQLGVKQGVLPPQQRPDLATLRRLGFAGNDAKVISAAYKAAPHLLAACYSASSMWAANAATISPSADTMDGKLHITPANLASKFHRSLEPATTARILKTIFNNPDYFIHHEPLPATEIFADEGAANHTRLCPSHAVQGIEFFVHGTANTKKFAPRQGGEASRAIVRMHQLQPSKVVYATQKGAAVDAGVFHNDVIAVGNENVIVYHEMAYDNTAQVLKDLRRAYGKNELHCIKISNKQLSLPQAVNTYLFNSQIITLPSGGMAFIAPYECKENNAAHDCLRRIVENKNNPIREVHFLDVRESMKNGGGPACLRLRVALTQDELAHIHPGVMLDERLFNRLNQWVVKHYRDRLPNKDLADPALARESIAALEELTKILNFPAIYPFQA